MVCDRLSLLSKFLQFRQIVQEAAVCPPGLGEFPFDDGRGRDVGAEPFANAGDHRRRRRVD